MAGITQEAAEKILEADFTNIVRKVRDGKTLTSTERARVQARAAGSSATLTEAKTIVELASALGVTRRTLSNWRKMPDAPEPKSNGKHDVVAWRKFLHDHHLDGSSPGDEEGLKVRKLLAEVNEREFRLSVRKGEYIRKDMVREAWLSRCGRVVNLLRAKFEKELPPVLSGKDAPSIQEALAEAIDEVLTALHDGEGKENSLTP